MIIRILDQRNNTSYTVDVDVNLKNKNDILTLIRDNVSSIYSISELYDFLSSHGVDFSEVTPTEEFVLAE